MNAILETLVATLVARRAVTVREDVSLATAARHMAAGRVGAAVVVRGARNIGLLSERDIVERIGAGVDPSTYTVGEAMTSPLVVADSTDTVRDALDCMATLGIRHLPVLDADVHLLGMISILELVEVLMDTRTEIDLREQPQEASRGFG